MDNLAVEFLETTLEQIELIESIAIQVKKGSASLADVNTVLRTIHSIKGISESYGYPHGSVICHSLEDFLNEGISLDHVPTIIKYCDLLNDYYSAGKVSDNDFVIDARQKLITLETSCSDALFKVLLVEPSRTVRAQFRNMVADLDVKVSECEDGYEALGRLLKEEFDIVCTSVQTTTIDGVALLKSLPIYNLPSKRLHKILSSSSRMPRELQEMPDFHLAKKDQNWGEAIRQIMCNIMDAKPVHANAQTLKRVLYVDDCAMMHKLVQVGFKKYPDISLFQCLDPTKALSMIEQSEPNVVLLDVIMEGVSGTEIFKEIQTAKESPPVIFVTGKSRQSEISDLMALGAKGVITKPIRPANLVDRVLEISF